MAVKKRRGAFTVYHLKLIVRLLILLAAVIVYAFTDKTQDLIESNKVFFGIVWVLFAFEMVTKLFFPLRTECMGSQKQFKSNYLPRLNENIKPKLKNSKRAIIVVALWVLLNAAVVYTFAKLKLDDSLMIFVMLFYSVCDMICVLVICPFQMIMGNRCCNTCRIHNWDYIMMCTPMLLLGNLYGLSLFVLSAIIFVRWEWTAIVHPERFSDETNLAITCGHCKEKICSRKCMKIK